MFPVFSSEARKFGETTSVRGIPRIIKSKTRVLFSIWLLGVATCGGLMLWQLTVVITRYFSYPVNTILVESTLNRNPTFPDIAICLNDPLVHENDMPVSFIQYLYALKNVLDKPDFQVSLTKNLGLLYNTSVANQLAVTDFLQTATAYFNNFPFVRTNKSDYKANSPILACNYINWDYTRNPYDCAGNVYEFWNPEYYKCYSVSMAPSQRQNVRGFTAVVYLNENVTSQLINYELSLRNSHGNGIRGMIYLPDSNPNMKLGGTIPPGSETTIGLNQVQRVRLPAPYSTCTNQTSLDIKYKDTGYSYTRKYCLDVCFQQQYIDKCHCIYSARLSTMHQAYQVNFTACGNMSISNRTNFASFWQGFGQLLCANSLDLDMDICDKECQVSCVEYTYSMAATSATTWPSISSQLAFYKTYIRRYSRFGDTFDEYETLMNLLTNGLPGENVTKQVIEKLHQMRLISDNFLQINVQFISATFDIEKDTAAFASDALGAQLGGVLSMWLGVTVMFVFEVCEFIIVLIMACYDTKQKKPSSTSSSIDRTQL